jgi:hypothetical protein
MKKSERPAARPKNGREDDLPELEFPVDPEFVSQSVRIEPEAMLERSQKNLAWRTSTPGWAQRRAEEKVDVEFRLS